MHRIGFIASFFATFITLDEQLFDGHTARAAWRELVYNTKVAQTQIVRWTYPILHRRG